MSTAIKIENVSKQYRLGVISTGTLSHDLNRWWTTKILRKEDPYLKIGSVNDRSQKADSEYVWALKDINMEIEQGDVVGIIGKNGAGKSTLLKLLSRVTKPTTGSIKYKGRIASLLEVGTGFHPEMTGRENIYMNGAIMGMTKQEITRKLDEIVDFSGCERYIDTPVKRYSSGMTVRLGFAIAAHLDPEILVVDEVLAVGDAEFQKKAIGKMQDVSKGEGRTVLFVSHNMAAVKKMCRHGIWLENGMIKEIGNTELIVANYLRNNEFLFHNVFLSTKAERKNSNQGIRIENFKILNENPKTGDELVFEYAICNESGKEKEVELAINFKTNDEIPILQLFSKDMNKKIVLKKGISIVEVRKKDFPLVEGTYICSLWVGTNVSYIDWIKNCFVLSLSCGKLRDVIVENRGYPLVSESEWIVKY